MNDIATSSIDEGLDFGLNLIADALAETGEREPSMAPALLRCLSQYVSLRYAGELRLAFEYLIDLSERVLEDVQYRREQFARQLDWLREALGPD